MRHFACTTSAALALLLLLNASPALAEAPLHERIDALIAAKFDGRTQAAQADDAAFFRRVWLDLAGTIPTSEATQAFLADQTPDKRAQLIDQLLSAPSYAQRMENLFHVMLMERLGDNEVWRKYLRKSFEENKPWDQLAREILGPDADDEATQGSGFFLSKRLENYGANPVDYPGLTRDVGRLFLGADLQCAECHNHLFIDDYKQVDFQGLFVVFKNLKPKKGDIPIVQETTLTDKLEFVSVFDPAPKKTGPRIPFGKEFEIPAPPPEEAKDKKEADKDQGEQKQAYSALKVIAEELPTTQNELFARNAANRLWFVLMGRGLVEPLDMFHSGNPPSHPELLDLLAREFVAHNFDIKWMLRELALTETYQRSSQLPEGEAEPPEASYLAAIEKRLSAEQLLASTLVATGNLERLSQSGEEGKPNEAFADLEKRFHDAFDNEAREPELDINPTVKASLFLLNDDKVLQLLQPQAGNLAERLAKGDEANKIVELLYLNYFSRLPNDEERAAVIEFLNENSDRQAALRQLQWAMLTSVEFCVNH